MRSGATVARPLRRTDAVAAPARPGNPGRARVPPNRRAISDKSIDSRSIRALQRHVPLLQEHASFTASQGPMAIGHRPSKIVFNPAEAVSLVDGGTVLRCRMMSHPPRRIVATDLAECDADHLRRGRGNACCACGERIARLPSTTGRHAFGPREREARRRRAEAEIMRRLRHGRPASPRPHEGRPARLRNSHARPATPA